MATIKSYSDLQQSKKLAEILPLESADHFHIIGHIHTDGPKYEVIRARNEVVETDKYWPCWSLAALLSIIPQEIFDGEYIINITEGLDNRWVLTYDHYKNRNHSYYGLSAGADNLVDACTDIITKLKERNII